jgi:hypothetical protein
VNINSSLIQRKTALIVGAGAVENAWNPVIRALQPFFSHLILDADSANSYLARVIYLLRWWASINTPFAKEQMKIHKEHLAEIREAICLELKNAQANGEIRERRELFSLIDKLVVDDGIAMMLVTTNWDRVVETALAQHLNVRFEVTLRPLHIHGSMNDANTLYLPTEVTKEPYRSHEEEQSIGGLHGSIWRGLEGVYRAVIYGLSLSPLDAELLQTLAAGFENPNLREIFVVVPEHKVIAGRINLLLNPARKIQVRGCAPGELDVLYNYTIQA